MVILALSKSTHLSSTATTVVQCSCTTATTVVEDVLHRGHQRETRRGGRSTLSRVSGNGGLYVSLQYGSRRFRRFSSTMVGSRHLRHVILRCLGWLTTLRCSSRRCHDVLICHARDKYIVLTRCKVATLNSCCISHEIVILVLTSPKSAIR